VISSLVGAVPVVGNDIRGGGSGGYSVGGAN